MIVKLKTVQHTVQHMLQFTNHHLDFPKLYDAMLFCEQGRVVDGDAWRFRQLGQWRSTIPVDNQGEVPQGEWASTI